MSLTPDLAGLTATAVYLVVLGFVFVESGLLVGFLLPGDSLLFAAGLVAADSPDVSLPVLIAGVLAAAVAGDSVGYAVGARLGRPWLERRARGGRFDMTHLRRAEAFYERYGWFAVVTARWIPWVRTFTPVLAGASRMPYARFLSANVVGATVWGVGLLLLGFAAASNPALRHASYAVAGLFVLGSLVLAVLGWARRR
ncbi:MAG: DedA family protein [Nocardioidaceae bacterium]